MVEPKATALGRRSWEADHKRDPLDANANRRQGMIINGRKLYDARPLTPMASMKLREHGVSLSLIHI